MYNLTEEERIKEQENLLPVPLNKMNDEKYKLLKILIITIIILEIMMIILLIMMIIILIMMIIILIMPT